MRRRLFALLSVLICLTMIFTMLPAAAAGPGAGTVNKETPGSATYVEDLTAWEIAPSGSTTLAAQFPDLALLGTDDAAIAASDSTAGWVPATVPGTVLGSLIDLHMYDFVFAPNNDGEYDPYFDENLLHISRSDFQNPWWYSTDFTLPTSEEGKNVMLTFKGINYTADVYVNGVQVVNKNLNIANENELRNRLGAGGDEGRVAGSNPQPPYTYVDPTGVNTSSNSSVYSDTVFNTYKDYYKGAFRTYDIDLTPYIEYDAPNNIKVKVRRNFIGEDFSIFWHDWHPAPSDNDMGLIGRAFITTYDKVQINNPVVVSKVAENLGSASLSFYIEATNLGAVDVVGAVRATVKDKDGAVVDQWQTPATVKANTYNNEIIVAEGRAFNNPDLWWPLGSGDQPLYTVDYEFVAEGSTLPNDTLHHRFGIREVSAEVHGMVAQPETNTTAGSNIMAQFYVNHLPIVIKSGGFCPHDLFLRQSDTDDRAFLEVVASMGMNMIRDEGKFYNDNLYDLMDEYGIMLMTGFMCCDRNEPGTGGDVTWSKAERMVVYESVYGQMRSLRSHPCLLAWLNGSDAPKDNNNGLNSWNVHRKMLEIEGRLRFHDVASAVSSAVTNTSRITGAGSGTEMDHAYDTAVPTAFYSANTSGATSGIYSFVSEGGGGGGIPSVESLWKFIPAENLWPHNVGHVGSGTGPGNYNKWNWHAARGNSNFTRIDNFVNIAENMYGGADNLDEWVYKSQLFGYEYQRAQYEALNVRRFVGATGFVNWMLNAPRPVVMWNQMDFYMNPYGSSYGIGKANEPVHIMYNPYNKNVHVLNTTPVDMGTLTATVKMYDIHGNRINGDVSKDVRVRSDGISSYSGTSTMRLTGLNPVRRDDIGTGAGETWVDGGFTIDYRSYGRRAATQTGSQMVFSKAEVDSSLIRPTTDVYFISLELADEDGTIISRNDYAVPRRQSVHNGNNWARSSYFQAGDLTQLNTLNPVDLDVAGNAGKLAADGIHYVQTVEIANNTNEVAYGVEVKAYRDNSRKDLLPSTYDDNLITLYPGESRIVTVTHLTELLNGPVVIGVNCFNNVIAGRPERSGNIYKPSDYTGQTATSATTNLARAKNSGTAVTATSAGNATAIANVNNANNGTTVIDGTLSTVATVASGASYYVNLGAATTFDRIMLRWSSAVGTGSVNWLSGVPNHVRIDVSTDAANWTTIVADYDNTNSRSAMSNVVLDAPCTAQYIRVTPSGLTGASALYGTNVGSGGGTNTNSSTNARAAASNVNINSIEVYRSFDTVTVEFSDNNNAVINVTSRDGNGLLGAATLDKSSPMLERVRQIPFGDKVEFVFTLDPATAIDLYANGALATTIDNGDGTVSWFADNTDGNMGSVLLYVVYCSVGVRADAESDIDKDVNFTLSVANADKLLTLEAEFLIDGSMLAGIGVEAQNGFTAMNDIFWASAGGDMWKGKVSLAYKAGANEGFTSAESTDVAKLVFAPRAVGDTTLTVTKVVTSGFDSNGKITYYFDTCIEPNSATTNIDQRAFSKYDLNRDNKVDALDLGIMLLYCGFDKDSPNWDTLVKVNDSRGKPVTASMCDVNGDGVIDMLDLLDLFIHYTK
ncbi:MAG: discoidin domain-containing protein [Clostridiales bacterium]|nr:discoidin domain-containing protein [Clostridiales bacterium]